MRKGEHIFELSHEGRQQIVELVLESPRKHSEIVKTLKMTPAEVSRHLQRLMGSRFIEKTPDARYTATSYGRLLFQELNHLNYLCKNWNFFDTHDISVIPKELFSWPVLTGAELIEGTLNIMEAFYGMTASADMYLWSISQIPVDPFIMENVHKLSMGVEMRLLYQEGSPVPSEYSSGRDFPLEIRTLDNVPLSIGINEREAIIVLPDLHGKIDYSFAMTDKEEHFLRWSALLFEYYWETGGGVRL